MSDAKSSLTTQRELLDKALIKHGSIKKNALMGKGWDRQLFALRKLAEERNLTHPLFSDPTYLVRGET